MKLSPIEKQESVVKRLRKKTGEGLESWIELVKNRGPKLRKDQKEWLKIRHHLSPEDANLIVKMMHAGGEDQENDLLIHNHFNNGKDYLQPVYDRLLLSVKDFGDFKVVANKTYLSLVNGRQFAILKLTTNGLIVAVAQHAVREARSRNFVPVKNLGPNKITHKILLNDVKEVNDEVIRVLKSAFKNNHY